MAAIDQVIVSPDNEPVFDSDHCLALESVAAAAALDRVTSAAGATRGRSQDQTACHFFAECRIPSDNPKLRGRVHVRGVGGNRIAEFQLRV